MKGKKICTKYVRNIVMGVMVLAVLLSGCSFQSQKTVAGCGSETLDAELFEYFYWMEYESYVYQWSDSIEQSSFDPYSSLAAQTRTTDGRTWQQYFIDEAMATVNRYLALISAANQDESYTLSAEHQKMIDAIADEVEYQAQLGGFESADELVQTLIFENATLDGYVRYYEIYVKANAYHDYLRDQIEVNDEIVHKQYSANQDSYYSDGADWSDNRNMVQIRHILIRPESDGEEYSDVQWNVAKATAETVLQEFLNGDQTVELFSELALAYSGDGSTYDSGGLYIHVYPGQFEEAMDIWAFDEARQPGDTALVQTSSGWHVLYFQGTESMPYWYYRAALDYAGLMMEDQVAQLVKQYPLQRMDENIKLSDMD